MPSLPQPPKNLKLKPSSPKHTTTPLPSTRDELVSELLNAGCIIRGNETTCPNPDHDDANPSGSIHQGDDERWRVKCHSCGFSGDLYDVRAKITGRPAAEVWKEAHTARPATQPRASTRPSSTAIATTPKVYATQQQAIQVLERQLGDHACQWVYQDAQGQPIRLVLRWNKPDGSKRDIRPIICTAGDWYVQGASAPPDGWALYHLPEMLAQPEAQVFVCEGEKAADAAQVIGLLATTSPQGSSSAINADWSTLAGRSVVILPDNDEAGKKYASVVSEILLKLNPAAKVRIVCLPDLAHIDGGDMADFLEMRTAAKLSYQTIKTEIETLAAQAKPARPPIVGGEPNLVCMNDIDPVEVAWLWHGRIPLGRMTLIVGRPGDGKSFITAFLAANVSLGGTWPDETLCPKGSVILCSAEDDPADTIAPRLIAHGADRREIHCLTGVMMSPDEEGNANEKVFTLADLDALRQTLELHKDCKLIVIDPIGSYLGGQADAHRDNDVRSVLAPACKLASEYGAALVVVAHTRKSIAANADDMTMGSRAFTGLARSVLHLMTDPKDPTKKRRLLLPGKNNLSERATGLAFDIGPGSTGVRPRVNWHEGEVDMTADEAVNHEPGGDDEQHTAKADSKMFLQTVLTDGPRLSKEVLAEAKEAEGISEKTLRRAVKEIGVRVYRPENPGPWWWRLPTMVEQMAKP